MPVMISMIKGLYVTNYGAMYLAVAISVIPIMLVFAFFSRYIIDGLTREECPESKVTSDLADRRRDRLRPNIGFLHAQRWHGNADRHVRLGQFFHRARHRHVDTAGPLYTDGYHRLHEHQWDCQCNGEQSAAQRHGLAHGQCDQLW